MAQPNFEAWEMEEPSPEVETLHNVQVNSDVFGSGSDEEYSLQTPEQKITLPKVGSEDHISETYLNSGNGSSDNSTKEGSEGMSSSSSHTEFSSCLPVQKYVARHVNDTEVLQPKRIEIEADAFDMKENLHTPERDGVSMLKENDILIGKLLEKVANYESELKFSKNEIEKLKYENLTLVEELGGTIEKLRISQENMKEMEIKLRNELWESENHLQANIDLANQSIHLLQTKLATEKNHNSELQETLGNVTIDLTERSQEVGKLKLSLSDAQEEKSKFENNIIILKEQNDALKTGLNEAELKNRSLEEQIQLYETKVKEIGKFHESREANWLNDIKLLQIKVSQKAQTVESLNKTLDSIKLRYDTLMSERDEIFAKLETKQAEVSSRDINIQQLEGHISKLSAEQSNLVDKLNKTAKLAEELNLKVMDQEKELDKQRVLVCDRADEKREAIRQLCFSLEYFRTEYQELRQVLLKYKRPLPAVMAS